MDNRDDNTILKFYKESEKLKNIPYEQVKKFILSTDYFIIDGCLFFIYKNTIHIHIPKDKQRKCNIRKAIRHISKFWFTKHDILYTTVAIDNNKADDFVRRVGFIKQSCDDKECLYYVNKLIINNIWGL